MTVEAKLYEEKELAQLTLENVVDGVIKTDKDGRLVSMNPSAEHISGWRVSDVLSKPLAEVLELMDPASGRHFLRTCQAR